MCALVTGVQTCSLPSYKKKSTNATIFRGEKLARDYCQRCHLFPDPSLLDKKTWNESVLPKMGWRLGIRENGINPYVDLEIGRASCRERVCRFVKISWGAFSLKKKKNKSSKNQMR